MKAYDLERAQAYQHLDRWTTEFKAHYDSGQYVGDWFLTTQLLVVKDGSAKFATPLELVAAEVLNSIIQIEATLESGEAYEAYNGTTLLEAIKSELTGYLDQLSRFAPNSSQKDIVVSIETASRSQLTRRGQQHQQILDEIAALVFDPMAIPDGGKASIKKMCLTYKTLFTDASFDHAWKDGLKRGIFRMKNHKSFGGKE